MLYGWFLILCSGTAYGGSVCLPAQPMKSEAVCKYVARKYYAISGPKGTSAACYYVRRDGQ